MTAKCSQIHTIGMKAKSKTHVLTVREVPDEVYQTLRDRAVTNRRSLQQEVRQVLTTGTQQAVFDWEGLQKIRTSTRNQIPVGTSLQILRELRGH